MKIVEVVFIVLISFVFQGCALNQKNLSENEVVLKALSSCYVSDNKATNLAILTIPSRGLLADNLSASSVKKTNNDGGFTENILALTRDKSDVAIYSHSRKRLKAYIENTLKRLPNNFLEGRTICLIGMEKEQKLIAEAKRVGNSLIFVP